MVINGETQIYAVLGKPIGHSLSPAMYNAAFLHLKLNSVYVACPVKEANLLEAVLGLKALGFKGGNVTVPYKEKIIPFLDGITEEARLIGAVNTLYYHQGGLWGTNTDGQGFVKDLRQIFEPRGQVVSILGAGGSARALAVALAQNGARKIILVNRTLAKAQEIKTLVKSLGCESEALTWQEEVLQDAIQEGGLIVNTTSLGMAPTQDITPPLDTNWLKKDQVVVDLIYKPRETLFLRQAKERGCQTRNGLGMLLEQGVLAFQTWSGQEAPVAVMAQALERWC